LAITNPPRSTVSLR